MKKELRISVLDRLSGLQAGPEVKSRMVLTNRDWFFPVGLEGKDWAGQEVEGVYLGQKGRNRH